MPRSAHHPPLDSCVLAAFLCLCLALHARASLSPLPEVAIPSAPSLSAWLLCGVYIHMHGWGKDRWKGEEQQRAAPLPQPLNTLRYLCMHLYMSCIYAAWLQSLCCCVYIVCVCVKSAAYNKSPELLLGAVRGREMGLFSDAFCLPAAASNDQRPYLNNLLADLPPPPTPPPKVQDYMGSLLEHISP